MRNYLQAVKEFLQFMRVYNESSDHWEKMSDSDKSNYIDKDAYIEECFALHLFTQSIMNGDLK
ncbi:MAG: hypothetical protein M0P91_09715 [Sulfuricurvum sp.]|jgi:hypothetical protein|uniref:hypothetical protein n=1 Tax=Sulfuricurvum sp. TaxID=2025608 RepID=UPI0025D843F2|nr:hypothetical protein [Sulfuricurvum sp.]MCK9373465.1 hypothetical protein [Sulfuricurvum sp.]